VVLAQCNAIEIDDLPPDVRQGGVTGDGRTLSFAVGTPLEEIERRVIHATLAHVGGDKRLCAQLLGIATRTIYRRLEEERIEPESAAAPPEEPAKRDVPNWQGPHAVGSR
jgi:two-component system, NtrC family, response regulator HydG